MIFIELRAGYENYESSIAAKLTLFGVSVYVRKVTRPYATVPMSMERWRAGIVINLPKFYRHWETKINAHI